MILMDGVSHFLSQLDTKNYRTCSEGCSRRIKEGDKTTVVGLTARSAFESVMILSEVS